MHSARIQAARQAALDAQRRVEEERLRIARELHDVVAHTMATITVQAAAATQLLRDRPDEAAESLKAIRAASKDGLRELRAILDVLRTADSAEDPADPTQPTPGLRAGLDDLVAGVHVRAAGLPVTVTVTGHPRDLPAVTDLSAYRIIQEALTNTLRHAGPATAAVTVDYGAAALRVEVTDTGHGFSDSAAEAAYAAYFMGAALPMPAPVTVKRDRGVSSAYIRPGRHWGARAARHARARHRGRRDDGHRRAACGRFSRRGDPAARHPARREGRRHRTDSEGGPMIRVLLADYQALIRAGFRVLLEAADDIQVIGEAVNGDEAVALAKSERPDVILMDIRMPGTDGLAATGQIAAAEALNGVRVVILTTFETDEYVYQALRAGASGFLVKDAEPEELIRAVRVVHQGEALLSPSVTRRLDLLARAPCPVRPRGRGHWHLRKHWRRGREPRAAHRRPVQDHRARARGAGPGRPGPVQRRDRGPLLPQPADHEDPCQPHHDQAARPRPRTARRHRLRVRPGRPWRHHLTGTARAWATCAPGG